MVAAYTPHASKIGSGRRNRGTVQCVPLQCNERCGVLSNRYLGFQQSSENFSIAMAALLNSVSVRGMVQELVEHSQ